MLPTIAGYALREELPAFRPEVRRFSAVQESLKREVELRMLVEPLGGSGELHLRFRKECEVLLQVEHPAVIKVLDLGIADGRLFYATDLREARTLGEVLAASGGALPPAEVFRMGAELLEGLDHLHRQGLLVRRLDPSSILLHEASGHYYLGDLAFLKKLGSGSLTEQGVTQMQGLPRLPEGRMVADFDPRSDLYLMAATLYQAFTGTDPRPELEAAIAAGRQPSLAPASQLKPELPRALDELLASGLASVPQARPATAQEMAGSLARAREALRAKEVAEASLASSRASAKAPSEWAQPSRRSRAVAAGESADVRLRKAVAAGGAVLALGLVALLGKLLRPEPGVDAPRHAAARAASAKSPASPVSEEVFAQFAAELAAQPTGTETFLRRWELAHRYLSARATGPSDERLGRLLALKLDYFREPPRACRALDGLVASLASKPPR